MTTSAASVSVRTVVAGKRQRPHYFTHLFLIIVSLIWFLPLGWAIYTSIRPYGDTGGNARGYFSIGGAYNLDNFFRAWDQAELPLHFLQTILVVIPALILILLFSSMVAFAVSRYSFRFTWGCSCCSRPATCSRSRWSSCRCSACTWRYRCSRRCPTAASGTTSCSGS